jgi:predicted nuclease of predicted toxin-antitoxin system
VRFLVDEDLPRSLARRLVSAGLDALDVRDAGLRGHTDPEIAARAKADGRVLVSADLGFANVLRYPTGSHPGMVVARLPSEVPASQLCETIVAALLGVQESDLAGGLLIIEPGRMRLRRP